MTKTLSLKATLIGTVIILIAVFAVVGFRFTKQSQKSSEVQVNSSSKAKGSDSAAVRIVGFSDFQCPACAHAIPVLDTLMSKYVDPGDMTEDEKDFIHLQGSPCPLCKFPTYNWVDDPESICDEMVIEAIQIDFPDWESRDGGCDRCIEVYELRAGVG